MEALRILIQWTLLIPIEAFGATFYTLVFTSPVLHRVMMFSDRILHLGASVNLSL